MNSILDGLGEEHTGLLANILVKAILELGHPLELTHEDIDKQAALKIVLMEEGMRGKIRFYLDK